MAEETKSKPRAAGRLGGRVAIVTGGGRGLGAAYAKRLAREGARVVVNDLGRGLHGEPTEDDPARQTAEAINAAGGEAIADHHDVADFAGVQALIAAAVERFGDLDVLVNNAGILRDRMLVNMSEQEWDDVIRVHLRGHFATTRHAAAYWRERSRTGPPRDAVLIETTSIAGLHGNLGQINYATAKSGIATMAMLAHLELNERYKVRAYAIAPGARTRLTLNSPGSADAVAPPAGGTFDFWDPDNVAPFIAWLAAPDCNAPSGTVYGVEGDVIRRYDPWHVAATIRAGGQWSLDELDRRAGELVRDYRTPPSAAEFAQEQALLIKS